MNREQMRAMRPSESRDLATAGFKDELGGKIQEGDVIMIRGFAPEFVLVRVEKINAIAPDDGQPFTPFMDVQAVPWKISLEAGKQHNKLVRVLYKDPSLPENAPEAAEQEAPAPRQREVLRFAEDGQAEVKQ